MHAEVVTLEAAYCPTCLNAIKSCLIRCRRRVPLIQRLDKYGKDRLQFMPSPHVLYTSS